MKTLLKITSYSGLVLTIIPSILVLKGIMDMKNHFMLMAIGMVLWFSTSPFWMKGTSLENKEQSDESTQA